MSYEKLLEAKAKLLKLKLELGVRENNDHVGTGMGGNPSELFFLLSHKVNVATTNDNKPKFTRGSSGQITFEVPSDVKMKDIRLAFTDFFTIQSDKKIVTSEQLSNPSFLRDQEQTLDIQLLTRAVEEGLTLAGWLDLKAELKKNISKTFRKEYEAIEISFLKEMGLPTSYFEDLEDKKRSAERAEDPMRKILDEHPVWGVKQTAARKRHDEMEKQLISQDDFDRLTLIGSMPEYITLFAFRRTIQIDRIVNFNLDESCQFLNTINKTIDK